MNLPLLRSADPGRPIIWSRGKCVTALELMSVVTATIEELPKGQGMINLCAERDAFLIAFCAALARGHANILPPSRAPEVVEEAAAAHPKSYRCDDEAILRARQKSATRPAAAKDRLLCDFAVPREHVAVIASTSGSTGVPQRHSKRWDAFVHTTTLNAERIRRLLHQAGHTARPSVVATVPPQHMYGLEMSILLPLLGDMTVHAGRPLFPADVAVALAEVGEPRVLVTTPVHLRAIAAAGVSFPSIALVVSATAPLDAALARSIEDRFSTTVLEMFGSTETCVIATRRPAQEQEWHLYPGVTIEPQTHQTKMSAPWFEGNVCLQDVLESLPDRRFMVRGRNADMVEVAGKRASLAELTQRLASLPGVKDAVVFQPDHSNNGLVRRVAAIAVAPGLTSEQLCEQLASRMDAAFIPRPLLLVQELPRNEVGKLPRERLLALLRGHSMD